MSGEERRILILNQLINSSKPVSGSELANILEVSRQVIVQDIALLRATNHSIISTNKGYLINAPIMKERIIKVFHTDEQIEDELMTIVDLGGTILDVYVNHEVYGEFKAPLDISSRRDVNNFINSLKSGKSKPLKNITLGYHFHTIQASSDEILDEIVDALKQKAYLIT